MELGFLEEKGKEGRLEDQVVYMYYQESLGWKFFVSYPPQYIIAVSSLSLFYKY